MPNSTLALRPYQVEGVDFLASHPRALLAFDTRLGKTLVALSAARKVDARRVLVLAPAIGRLSWELEAPKAGWPTVRVVTPGQGPGAFLVRPAADLLLVLAYDTLSHDKHGWVNALAGVPWDLMILDECQYLKNMGSRRTQAVYDRIRPKCKRIWLLSGTPTPNHAGEMWPHVSALWPMKEYPGRHAFEDRFCEVENTPYGRRITGSRNQDELRERLAPVIMRRRKRDVIPDLPAMAHDLVPLDLPKTTTPEVGQTELELLLSGATNADTAGTQQRLGLNKLPGAVDWLQEQLSQSIIQKVIVFAWHRAVLDGLMEGLADFEPVRIDGGTSETARREAVSRFQGRPATRVFVGQIRACGTAICLDAADDVAFVEPSWVPMDNYQAASRAENVGRRKAVTVSWLTAPDPLDAQLMRALRAKTRDISALWD